MPTFNAEKMLNELKGESKATELDLSTYTIPDEKATLPSKPLATLMGREGRVTALAVLPDGHFISGSSDKTIKLWDGQGECLTTLTGHTDSVSALAVLPDGRLISGSLDGIIKLWDPQGKCLATLAGGGSNYAVNTLAVLPDGRFISGNNNGAISLWDGQGKYLTSQWLSGSVRALAVLPDGRFLGGGNYCSSTEINLYDGQGKYLATLTTAEDYCVTALAALPDDHFISISDWFLSKEHAIKLWNEKGKCLGTLTGHEKMVTALAVLPHGRFISGSYDETIKLWDPQGKCLATLQTKHKDGVYGLAVLPDGRFISSGYNDIKLWQGIVLRPLCWNDIAPVLVALAQQHNIKKLNLQKVKLGDDDIPVLLKALQAASGLTQIDLRETAISAEGVKILRQGLTGKEILHPAMAEILKLEQLAAEKQALVLKEQLANQQKQLEQLRQEQEAALAEKQRQEKAARDRQKLQQMRATQQAREEKANAAEKAKLAATFTHPLQKIITALQNDTIVELDLTKEKIFDETVRWYLRPLVFKDLTAFFEALQTNHSLKKLSLQQIILEDKAILSLATVLSTNTTLAELNLTQTGVTKLGIEELQQKLKTRKGFLQLRHESSLISLILGTAPLEEKTSLIKEEKVAHPMTSQSPPVKETSGLSVSYIINYQELTFGKKLGQGGFGAVYQATWRHDDVAVKQLLSQKLSDDTLEEFKTEAHVMARLRSSSIVQFYGYCESPHYCLVMEYMPKGSLYNVLHSNQTLDWPVRYQMATDIARGVAFLHQENILHRDIKSLNVLLNNQLQAKLTDFGLSKIKKESQTTTKGSVGTVAWMAPELFERKGKYTQKSDIYSMGITFWEIAARKIPFEDAESQAVIPNWVTKGERPDEVEDCPKKFASLIKFCWASDSSKRPSADKVVGYLKSQAEDFATFSSESPSNNTAQTEVKASDDATRISSQSASSSIPQYRSNLISAQTTLSLRK